MKDFISYIKLKYPNGGKYILAFTIVKKLLFIAFLLFSNTNCSKEFNIDLNEFETVEKEDLYLKLDPEIAYDYFEIRYGFCGAQEYEIEYSRGELCKGSGNIQECKNQFETIFLDDAGFHLGCLPACCNYYIVAQNNLENITFKNTEELRDFLGEINSESDALLLVFSDGYNFHYGIKEEAAIKKVADGYEIIVSKMVKYCDPIQTDLFHLKVYSNGEMEILNRKILDKLDGACI